jgi:hypothetical protein
MKHALALVLRSTKRLTNEIDGFVRQARRKAQQYRVVLRGFATKQTARIRDAPAAMDLFRGSLSDQHWR